jgi:hypothetical protein
VGDVESGIIIVMIYTEPDLEEFSRKQLLFEANVAYGNLREDEKAWSEFQEELSVWDVAIADGLKASF